jgi:uncharacterized membrane protein
MMITLTGMMVMMTMMTMMSLATMVVLLLVQVGKDKSVPASEKAALEAVYKALSDGKPARDVLPSLAPDEQA